MKVRQKMNGSRAKLSKLLDQRLKVKGAGFEDDDDDFEY